MQPQKSKVMAYVLVATQLLGVGAMAADTCINPKELEADKVRYIETQIRVAALQCRDQKHSDLPLLYNDFILENRPYLVRAQQPLKKYLLRAGQQSVEHYIGKVANRISVESVAVSQFCNRAMLAVMLSSKTAHPVKLLSLMPVEYRRPAARCSSKSKQRS